MEGYTVERPSRDDIGELAAMQCATAMETEGLKLDPATVRKGVENLMNKPARGFYLVAVCEGELVGCLQVIREWSDWRNGEIWSLHSMFVKPEHRRNGVFSALAGEVRRQALDGNVLLVRIPVLQGNEAGGATCRALGFTESGYHDYIFEP